MYFVGIDWADQKHDIAILGEDGKPVFASFSIPKNYRGFEKLFDKLRALSANSQHFKIGIETPHNLLVDFLLDLGYPVFAIFPGSMKSFRKRYRSSSARDDAFDCFVLADVLRTDRRCWRPVDLGSLLIREIRILVRDHLGLIEQQTALGNSLRSTLKVYYPEYIHFFSDIACPTSLNFLLAFPDYQTAANLSIEQLVQFFKEQHYQNRKSVNKIYELLHQHHLKVNPALLRAKRYKAIGCAKQLIHLIAEIDAYSQRIKTLVEEHPDGNIFLSYPGVGHITAARLMALFTDNREHYSEISEVQALTGTCPVTEKSGKNFSVTYYRTACNKFYRNLMHNLAFSSLSEAEWALAYYRKHRQLGKNHSHALRCLANLHSKILFAMWKNRTSYDENIFLAQRERHNIQSK
jgi:transposase